MRFLLHTKIFCIEATYLPLQAKITAMAEAAQLMQSLAPSEIIKAILSQVEYIDLFQLLRLNHRYYDVVQPMITRSIITTFKTSDHPTTSSKPRPSFLTVEEFGRTFFPYTHLKAQMASLPALEPGFFDNITSLTFNLKDAPQLNHDLLRFAVLYFPHLLDLKLLNFVADDHQKDDWYATIDKLGLEEWPSESSPLQSLEIVCPANYDGQSFLGSVFAFLDCFGTSGIVCNVSFAVFFCVSRVF